MRSGKDGAKQEHRSFLQAEAGGEKRDHEVEADAEAEEHLEVERAVEDEAGYF